MELISQTATLTLDSPASLDVTKVREVLEKHHLVLLRLKWNDDDGALMKQIVDSLGVSNPHDTSPNSEIWDIRPIFEEAPVKARSHTMEEVSVLD